MRYFNDLLSGFSDAVVGLLTPRSLHSAEQIVELTSYDISLGHFKPCEQPDFIQLLRKDVELGQRRIRDRCLSYSEFLELHRVAPRAFEELPPKILTREEFFRSASIAENSVIELSVRSSPINPEKFRRTVKDSTTEFDRTKFFHDQESYKREFARWQEGKSAYKPGQPNRNDPKYYVQKESCRREIDQERLNQARHVQRRRELEKQSQSDRKRLEGHQRESQRDEEYQAYLTQQGKKAPVMVPTQEMRRYAPFRFATAHSSLEEFVSKYSPDESGYGKCVRRCARFLPWIGEYFESRTLLISERHRRKHTYITGGSGSGKTEVMKSLIHQYLSQKPRKCSVMVLDPHGDMVREIAQHESVAGRPDNVFYFDATLGAGLLPRFNPLQLAQRDPRAVDCYAQHLTNAFVELLAENSLTANMRTLVKACLNVLLRMEGATLNDLLRMVDDRRNADLVNRGKHLPNPSDRDFFVHSFYRSNLDSSKSALAIKLQSLLGNHAFQRVTTQRSTFDIEALLNGNCVLLFNLNKNALGSDGGDALGRFLIATAKAVAFGRARLPESQRPATHLFADEFQNYVGESSQEILTETRKYRLYMTVASQIVGQAMTASFRKILMANTNLKIVGRNTTDSLRVMAQESGVAIDQLQQLTVGEFFVKCMESSIPARKVRIPETFVGKSGRASSETLRSFRQDQLNRYYVEDATLQAEASDVAAPDRHPVKPIRPGGSF